MTLQNHGQIYSDNSTTEEMSANSANFDTVTKEKYSHLLNLINTGSSNSIDNRHVLLAGKFCLFSAFSSDWIVDSGSNVKS